MPANQLVQARIDGAVKEEATAVLAAMGLTVSDAVRLLLTRKCGLFAHAPAFSRHHHGHDYCGHGCAHLHIEWATWHEKLFTVSTTSPMARAQGRCAI